MTRAEWKKKNVEWLKNAKVGDEVCITNTSTTSSNIFGSILANFQGMGTSRITEDGSYVEEFCTITTIRAIIDDGYVVDNNVYDSNGNQQTEQPVFKEGDIPEDFKLLRNTAITRGCEATPESNKTVEKGELCEPTDELRTLAGVLRFNSEIKTFNFRDFDPTVIKSVIGTVNTEIERITRDGLTVKTYLD